VLATQVEKHCCFVESQEKGAQISVGPGRHWPSEVQTFSPTTASFSQLPARHTVPGTCRRQAPAPSHFPSRPQVDAASARQVDAVRGSEPAGKFTQLPAMPSAAQVLHPSVHALVQQTPSTQKPLAHSPEQVHASPVSLLEGVGHAMVSPCASPSGPSPDAVSVFASASDLPPSPPSVLAGCLSPHAAPAISAATANVRTRAETVPAGLLTNRRMTTPSPR